ncbi:hypothetical protein PBAL39_01442 [Pedobacter sp. BAL39]|uniref:sialate O-acetylesterase n=1 Tax=Pedobacter sp. BAL39 TaxID=391596 RepID=UPI00015595C4|nr:sialate O-acetylesterase [Pedobacter sp. BAL39]EDM38237.1 hypothetical protein PBAL39_01442 [Pedobacter sp. BAL39]
MKNWLKYTLVLGVGSIIGIIANRNREYLINAQYIRDHWSFRDKLDKGIATHPADGTMVFLAFGQSNSANYGEGDYKSRHQVYNYYKGNVYLAQEPLLGPDGAGNSVWTRVADLVIDSGLYKNVIIVPCGIGSTSVQCWAEGKCRKKLEETLAYLKKDHIKLTHIFWDQGETDNVDGTTKAEYKARLQQVIKVIRDQGFDAPFYSSVTSYFPYDNEHPMGIDTGITTAQMELINERDDVIEGPNTDSLNLAYYRFNAVHFTEAGLDKLAHEWFKKIKNGK